MALTDDPVSDKQFKYALVLMKRLGLPTDRLTRQHLDGYIGELGRLDEEHIGMTIREALDDIGSWFASGYIKDLKTRLKWKLEENLDAPGVRWVVDVESWDHGTRTIAYGEDGAYGMPLEEAEAVARHQRRITRGCRVSKRAVATSEWRG